MPGADPEYLTPSALQKRKLRHGFKAEAKRRSADVRRAHGFDDYEPLDCRELAKGLGIVVYHLSDLDPAESAHYLRTVEPSAFSAATLKCEGLVGVIINDAHEPERQASNLAHEVGHVVLEHEDAPWLNDSGCRAVHADVEAEANYFGSVLLVTDEAVMRLARQDVPVAEAASLYGVSVQMMRWRYNDSGALKRVAAERARRRRQ